MCCPLLLLDCTMAPRLPPLRWPGPCTRLAHGVPQTHALHLWEVDAVAAAANFVSGYRGAACGPVVSTSSAPMGMPVAYYTLDCAMDVLTPHVHWDTIKQLQSQWLVNLLVKEVCVWTLVSDTFIWGFFFSLRNLLLQIPFRQQPFAYSTWWSVDNIWTCVCCNSCNFVFFAVNACNKKIV